MRPFPNQFHLDCISRLAEECEWWLTDVQQRKFTEERAAAARTGNHDKEDKLELEAESDLEPSDGDDADIVAGQQLLDVEGRESDGESDVGTIDSSDGNTGEDLIYQHDNSDNYRDVFNSCQAAFEVPDDELRASFRQLEDAPEHVECVHGAR